MRRIRHECMLKARYTHVKVMIETSVKDHEQNQLFQWTINLFQWKINRFIEQIDLFNGKIGFFIENRSLQWKIRSFLWKIDCFMKRSVCSMKKSICSLKNRFFLFMNKSIFSIEIDFSLQQTILFIEQIDFHERTYSSMKR